MTQIAKLVSTDGQGETQDLESCCFHYFITKSCLTLFVNPWTVTHQVSLSMGFPKQEYWSGLPSPSLGDLSDPRIEFASPALAGRFFTTEPPRKPLSHVDMLLNFSLFFFSSYTHSPDNLIHSHSFKCQLTLRSFITTFSALTSPKL